MPGSSRFHGTGRSVRIAAHHQSLSKGGFMESVLLDAAGHRRSPATMPGNHRGRPPRNKGEQHPADPPTVEEIVAVMRTIGDRATARRRRCAGIGIDRLETPWRQFGLTNVGCQSRLTAMNTEDITSAIASDDPSLGLRAALALHRLAERVEADHVAAAREKGWSWQQIGDALGVTRQSVHTKYNNESS
jgi:hypothetical protein